MERVPILDAVSSSYSPSGYQSVHSLLSSVLIIMYDINIPPRHAVLLSTIISLSLPWLACSITQRPRCLHQHFLAPIFKWHGRKNRPLQGHSKQPGRQEKALDTSQSRQSDKSVARTQICIFELGAENRIFSLPPTPSPHPCSSSSCSSSPPHPLSFIYSFALKLPL